MLSNLGKTACLSSHSIFITAVGSGPTHAANADSAVAIQHHFTHQREGFEVARDEIAARRPLGCDAEQHERHCWRRASLPKQVIEGAFVIRNAARHPFLQLFHR